MYLTQAFNMLRVSVVGERAAQLVQSGQRIERHTAVEPASPSVTPVYECVRYRKHAR